MKIDGYDVYEIYGAKQWNVTPTYRDIKNGSEWAENALTPFLIPGTTTMKKYKVSVLIYGKDRQEIWSRGSRLISKLLKPCVINLDGFDNNFLFILTNASQAESCIKRWHKATLELQGYEYGNEVVTVFQNQTSFTIDNPGTAETPCSIEITPTIGKDALTITGITRDPFTGQDKPVKINGLRSGSTILISDEGLIQEGGTSKMEDVELYAVPSLIPGTNLVTLNQQDMNVKITYKPMYL